MTNTSTPPPGGTLAAGVVLSADPAPPTVPGLFPASADGAEQDREQAIREWLASTHPSPSQARKEWAENSLALLPLGDAVAAIRIPGHLVHRLAGGTDRKTVAAALTRELRGPVVVDDRHSVGTAYYALIAPRADLTWPLPEAPYLGANTWLGVPDITRSTPPGTYWVVPPRYVDDLCQLHAVADFILRALQATAWDTLGGGDQ